MRVSWNWLSELVNLDSIGGPGALAELLTRRGLEVEAVERQDQGLEGVVVAEILERNPHPQADRLSLCKVSKGGGESLDIVCGAQNMKAGDRIALAQIGSLLPNGLKIQQSKIRGVVSNGMLCSEEELKLKDKSEGILILPPGTPLGKPLAEILGRDDTILVFKLTANRGDCLSHWGMAREVAAALGQKPKRPEGLSLSRLGLPSGPIAVELEAGEAAPQFFGCYIDGVKVGPSPAWVVKRLEALGSRSISNVVDATNLLMLELGQPVHAYDADRIQGKRIAVRRAGERESLPLLDGQSVTLNAGELVIADAERAVGLAGVMGGGNSEVSEGTTRVFLECAEFDPSLVRRAASRHGRRTDAAHRFERGIDPAGLTHAIGRLAGLVTELAGGRITGFTSKKESTRSDEALATGRKIRVNVDYFARFLGMSVTAAQAEKILSDLQCEIAKDGKDPNVWSVRVPSFRLDLNLPQDLAEEIARTLGYDQIAETVPALGSAPTAQAEQKLALNFHWVEKAKNALVQAGLNETVNFAFTSRARLSRFGMVSTATVINPLSEDLEALVPSLLPGLVQNSLDNWNRHFGSEALAVRLFELRPTFYSADAIAARGEMETGVEERWKLAIAISGPRYASALRNELGEVDFYDLRAVIEAMSDALGIRGLRYQPLTASRSGGHSLFHPGQSVEVLAGKGDVVGVFGLLHPGKALELKTRAPLWLAELNWDALTKLARPAGQERSFKPWPEFPSIERDFALLVKSDVTADRITQVAVKAGKPLARGAKIFDVYRGSQVASGMTSVAVRVTFFDDARSLQESEAETASVAILAAWKRELGAELRG